MVEIVLKRNSFKISDIMLWVWNSLSTYLNLLNIDFLMELLMLFVFIAMTLRCLLIVLDDRSRVILDVIDEDPFSDYMNANYVDVSHSSYF